MDETLHRVLLEAPLVEALEAARELANEPTPDISDIIAAFPSEEWRRRLLRLSLRTAGTHVAPAVTDLIKDAYASWKLASNAVELLSPALHNQTAPMLADALRNSDMEAMRLEVEALGRIGAAGYAADIVRLLPGYTSALLDDDDDGEAYEFEWEKFGPSVALALARMVRWCEDAHGPGAELVRDNSMQTLSAFLTKCGRRIDRVDGSSQTFITREMRRLRPWHADSLIRYFLRSPDERLVCLGATALGHMQLLRSAPEIVRRLTDADLLSNGTERILMLELARIGGSFAVEFFLGEGSKFATARTALHLCLDSVPDSQFEELVHASVREHPKESWRLYRAIGKRPWPSLIGYLEQGLTSFEPSDRGVSALALATAKGPAAINRLMIADREAANSFEKNHIAVALLIATDGYKPIEGVEESMAREAWLYEGILFDDLTAALDERGGNRGSSLATALRWLNTAP